jgi:hypothetical protein
MSDQPVAETSASLHTQHLTTNIHAPGGIRTRNPSKRSSADSRLRVKTHILRGGAERLAACDFIRGNNEVVLLPRMKSQAAGRSALYVFLPLDRSATGIGYKQTNKF